MPSVIDICNRALDKLGQTPITALTDGTTVANAVVRAWPFVRDRVLRDHPWNFAIRRDTLAPLVDAPDWGFAYQFELPSDCLRVLDFDNLRAEDYQIEGGKVMANDDTLYIRYVAKIEDPVEYDALFVDAVTSHMALELCEKVTQSSTKKKDLLYEYEENLKRAKAVDGLENPVIPLAEDDWILARY